MKLARHFRESARNSLRGKWGLAAIASVIASMLGGNLFDLDFNITYEEEGEQITVTNPEFFDQLYAMLLLSLPYILVGTFIALVIGSTVKVGHAKFYLDLLDAYPPSIGTLFSYFRRWGTAVLTELLKLVIIIFGVILFFVPGIIAAYSLSMTPYIIAENDGIKVIDAMKESHRIMRGNRFRLFCLHISFIGWILLSIITLGIGFLWVNPYLNAACTDFYRSITDSYRIPYLHVDEPEETTDSGESNDWFYGN